MYICIYIYIYIFLYYDYYYYYSFSSSYFYYYYYHHYYDDDYYDDYNYYCYDLNQLPETVKAPATAEAEAGQTQAEAGHSAKRQGTRIRSLIKASFRWAPL